MIARRGFWPKGLWAGWGAALLLALAPAAGPAQETPPDEPAPADAPQESPPAGEEASAMPRGRAEAPSGTAGRATGDRVDIEEARQRVQRAIRLPRAAEEARDAGIEEQDVRIVLEESRRRGLPPEETVAILEEGARAAREGESMDNFGSFVQQKLDAGLRGRDLAAAIHAEKAERGRAPDGAGRESDKAGQGRAKGKSKKKGSRP